MVPPHPAVKPSAAGRSRDGATCSVRAADERHTAPAGPQRQPGYIAATARRLTVAHLPRQRAPAATAAASEKRAPVVMLSDFTVRLALLSAGAAAVAADCPGDDWQQFRDKCYWVSDYTLNGRSVASVCRSMVADAEPVSIHDLDLDAFIGENLTKGQRAWLGLHRADTNAAWTWADGSPMNFTMWLDVEGEPNHQGEACGSINWHKVGFWSDETCDTFYKLFACQVDT